VAANPCIDNLPLSAIALFLDVDGTLLEIAATPQAVSVPDDLRERLHALFVASGGAVALVSGRAISDLDALFAPLTLAAGGRRPPRPRSSLHAPQCCISRGRTRV
jgi:trehalose 6-phosphate phosphatase